MSAAVDLAVRADSRAPQKANAWSLLRTLPGTGEYATVAFSPDGRLVALGGKDSVHLWDARREDWSPSLEHGSKVTSLAFDGQGRLASASYGDGGGVRLWNLETGRCLWRRKASTTRIAFTPDGELIACLEDEHPHHSGGGAVRLVHAAGWRKGRTYRTVVEAGAVGGIAINPDGTLLATGNASQSGDVQEEGVVRLFDLGRRAHVGSLHGADLAGWIHHVAFSPNGKLLASAGYVDDEVGIRLWDVDGGRCLHSLPAGDVSSMSFSADGSLLAEVTQPSSLDSTATRAGGVRLWDVERGLPLGLLEEGITMETVAFGPAEDVLAATGFVYGSVWLWTAAGAKGWGRRSLSDTSAEIFELDRSLNAEWAIFGDEPLWLQRRKELCDDRLTEIGKDLHAEGGEDLMRRALGLAQQFGLAGRYVERHWTGIASWLG